MRLVFSTISLIGSKVKLNLRFERRIAVQLARQNKNSSTKFFSSVRSPNNTEISRPCFVFRRRTDILLQNEVANFEKLNALVHDRSQKPQSLGHCQNFHFHSFKECGEANPRTSPLSQSQRPLQSKPHQSVLSTDISS